MRQGQTQIIAADLSKYFDSIPHAKFMATVAERLVDGAVLALIQQYQSHTAGLVWVFPLSELHGGISEGETSRGRAAENPFTQAAQGDELENSTDPVSEARAV